MQRPKDAITQQVNYDGDLNLSLASTKTEKRWKNRTMKWSEFLQRLQTPTITQETAADYAAMPKSRRDDIKDVGGFVGGFLKEGKRKKGNAEMRSLVTLDADSTTSDLWEAVNLLFDHAAAVYTTHSHTGKKPRYRLIFPLSRPVTAEEYEPLARKIAEMFGMDNFDDTTYQAERLMYWASHSIDGEYFTDHQDLPWVNPDEVLAQYVDWEDSSFWPESSRGHSIRERQAKKAGDPLEKKGVVGAFCRSYDIVAAIEKFLPEVYGSTIHADRYTFMGGSTSGGLVIYDGKFAYSHHGTDPVGDQLVNSFDLVRIHLYGDLDEDAKLGTPPQKMKSYQAMNEWLQEDETIISQMRKERLGEALDDFSGIELDASPDAIETGWLTFDGRGNPEVNTYLLAQEVASEIPFFYDGSEFLRYDSTKGIWVDGADEYIRSYLTNRKLLKESKIRYMSECIASIKNLVFTEQAFEEMNVNKLVLANGVYDLKEDSFSPGFDKDLYARNSHPVIYDATADCPIFDGYLQHVVGPENVDFVYEWFGYNFYREYAIQKLVFLHGKGGTGKSTLVNILKQLLGTDSYSAVSLKSLMMERFAPAWLHCKTANFDTDAKPEYLADGSLLKQLTGEDTIYADRKNQDPIFFYNYAKLTFAMNELPAMRDFTGGLRRRVIILSIDKELTAAVKKKYPLEAMKQEGAGIFNKAMEGLRAALDRGAFSISEGMDSNLQRWIKGNDVLSLFIEDECEIGTDKKTPVSEAYSDYVTYCKGSGYKQMTRNKFKARLEELGFENKPVKVGGSSVRCWVGIDTGNGSF